MRSSHNTKRAFDDYNRWFKFRYIRPGRIRLWILIASIIVLGSGLAATGSRKFLTGLIIGTLLARNGQYGGQPSYQPSYSYQPPPSYPSHSSGSNQPLLIIIPTTSGKGSSYKAQPAYSHPPPPPPHPPATHKSETDPQYTPAAEHSSYSDRASARRRVSSHVRSSLQAHGSMAAAAQRKLIDKIIVEPSQRIRHHIGLPLVSHPHHHLSRQSSSSGLISQHPQLVAPSEPTSPSGSYNLLEPQELYVSR